jgi:hypothetical protein
MDNHLKSFLKKNDYRVFDRDGMLIIRKNRMVSMFLVTLFSFLGLFFLFFWWKWQAIVLLVIGLLFIVPPWLIVHFRGAVRHIKISLKGDEVALLKGWTRLTTLTKKDIDSLHVFERVEQSHTSSFEEGYQDFVYCIYLRTHTMGDIKIIEIRSREPESENVVALVKYLELVV